MKKNTKLLMAFLLFALSPQANVHAVIDDAPYGYGGQGDHVTCSLLAMPDTISPGGGALLTWDVSSNVSSAYLTPKNSRSWIQQVPLDGSWWISGITDTRAYTLHVEGHNGQTSSCDAYIMVETVIEEVPSCEIMAVPSTISSSGGATTLSWTSSNNVVSATLHPKNSTSWTQSVPMNGSWYISGIVDSRSYALTVETAGGLTHTCDVYVTVQGEMPDEENGNETIDSTPSCTITAVPTTIQVGGGTTLVWESTPNVVSVKLSPKNSTSYFATVTPSGSWWISGITNTREYSATVFTDDNKSAVCTVQISVVQ